MTIARIGKKKLASLGGKMPFSSIPRSSKVPWKMCRTCHRKGTPSPRSILRCSTHPVEAVGECGQCGKRRPLVTCHSYDFRAYSFRKAPRKRNPKRIAKRKAGYRKMLSGKEYKAARAEAMERAGGYCEGEGEYLACNGQGVGYALVKGRCWASEDLHAHHLRYPKTRPLAASDLKILCKPHHEQAEAAKMHKTRMF